MGGLFDPRYPYPFSGLYSLLPRPAATTLLGGLLSPPPPSTILGGAVPTIKRKAYFAFHYDDVMRVNNVRMAWKIDHPDSQEARSFYDSSLWEERKLADIEAIKRLIRTGVEYTSAVCVLVGTDTWRRRWVKYEIARSVVDRRGLLAVHINGLKHHRRGSADTRGVNPLKLLGIGRSPSGQYVLFERRQIVTSSFTNQTEWQWLPYEDYTLPVSLPRYLLPPDPGYVRLLSGGTHEYDFVSGGGHRNIGAWIDAAARGAGR